MIIDGSRDTVMVIIFMRVCPKTNKKFSLRPVMANKYPMAHQGNMIEVLGSMVQ
jgi:hypothetical protein